MRSASADVARSPPQELGNWVGSWRGSSDTTGDDRKAAEHPLARCETGPPSSACGMDRHARSSQCGEPFLRPRRSSPRVRRAAEYARVREPAWCSGTQRRVPGQTAPSSPALRALTRSARLPHRPQPCEALPTSLPQQVWHGIHSSPAVLPTPWSRARTVPARPLRSAAGRRGHASPPPCSTARSASWCSSPSVLRRSEHLPPIPLTWLRFPHTSRYAPSGLVQSLERGSPGGARGSLTGDRRLRWRWIAGRYFQ